ncbi:MAG: glycosyltransferase [Cytophagaceae bacterium]|nr:glycosyltransferase [Cytophagaceae bacterium]
MIVLQIIFWLCWLLVIHSYVLFPLILSLLMGQKKNNAIVYAKTEDLPHVDILLAVYNEEVVMDRKIQSTFETNYPLDKIHFYIGSDNSTDATNAIIEKYKAKYPQLSLTIFAGRTGKPNIINQLFENSSSPILVLTDANVFFYPETIYELVKHYKNEEIAVVGGNLINEHHSKEGIAVQENEYLKRENQMKYQEGVLWGAMIGAFGGCFAIRRAEYKPAPATYIVDDFYISMSVFLNHKKSINELSAVYYEDITDKIKEEFRRKVRISIGNFQNLGSLKSILWPLTSGLAFSFISHKILRWFAPVFIITALLVNLFLLPVHDFYQLTFIGQLTLMIVPFIDDLLKKVNIHFSLLRFISHFYVMNLALLIGLVNYTTGVKTNIWKPTERNT